MAKSIRLSPQHGVNPSLMVCYYCGEDKGIALMGLIRGKERSDPEAPRHVVLDKEPCDKCKEYMKEGVILIEVRDGEHGDRPYRMGGYAVVRDDWIKRAIQPAELCADILKKRVTFIETSTWDMIGLPREVKSNDNQ